MKFSIKERSYSSDSYAKLALCCIALIYNQTENTRTHMPSNETKSKTQTKPRELNHKAILNLINC